MATEQFEITAEQYRIACIELEKLDKLAAKLGTSRITIYVDKREWLPVPDKQDEMYERLTVTVSGDVPVLEGWQYVATIQHEAGGNIIRVSPFVGDRLDTSAYRSFLAKCDHCGQYRNRKDTYIVHNVEERRMMQVGSSCLKDFVRATDPLLLMRYIEMLMDFQASMESAFDEDGYPSDGYGATLLPLERLMAHTFLMVENHGWIGKSKALEYDKVATVTRALDNLDKTANPGKCKGYNDLPLPVEVRHIERATAAIQWIRDYAAANTVEQRNDYMHNLCVVTAADAIEYRSAGVAASLAYAYTRHLDDEQERKVRSTSEANVHVATVGSKFRLTDVAVVQRWERDNGFGGTSFTYILKTPVGVTFKWTTGKYFEHGTVLAMNVTVKEHTEYKGWKQTVLGRCTQVVVTNEPAVESGN